MAYGNTISIDESLRIRWMLSAMTQNETPLRKPKLACDFMLKRVQKPEHVHITWVLHLLKIHYFSNVPH